jgi:hypothetical protein
VTVAHKEISVELSKVQWYHANAMGAIDHTEYAIFFAHFRDSLKREPDSGQRDYGVKYANLGCISIVNDARYGLRKSVENFRMCAGQRIAKVLSMADFAKMNLRICLED